MAIVRRLIEAGADVNQRLEEERTCLLVAAAQGDVPMVRLLARAGADAEAGSLLNDFLLDSPKPAMRLLALAVRTLFARF